MLAPAFAAASAAPSTPAVLAPVSAEACCVLPAAASIALRVLGPACPSTVKLFAFWNAWTAAYVPLPYFPSTPFGSKPKSLSFCCISLISGIAFLPPSLYAFIKFALYCFSGVVAETLVAVGVSLVGLLGPA